MPGPPPDDFALPRLGELVGRLTDHPAVGEPHVGVLSVESVYLDLPLELQVTSLGGTVVRLGAAPPTQWVETSVMPVFHRLRLRVALAPEA